MAKGSSSKEALRGLFSNFNEPKTHSAETVKCPGCGSQVDIVNGSGACEYCGYLVRK